MLFEKDSQKCGDDPGSRMLEVLLEAFRPGRLLPDAPSEECGGEREYTSRLLWRWKTSAARAREMRAVGHDKTGGTAN